MAKHNKTGRAPAAPTYCQLHNWLLDSPAWRALNPYARCLYVEIKRRYNGRNNGGISMSYREAETLLGCSNKPVPGAFRDLRDKGFIRTQQRGKFKGVPLATTWILTELPQDEPVKSLIPTKDFMSWKPTEKKTRHAESGLSARPKRAVNEGAARRERAVSTLRAYSEGPFSPSRSTLKAGTCNIPDTSGATAAREAPANQKAGAARADALRDGDEPRAFGDIVAGLDFWRQVKAEALRLETETAGAA